MGLGLCGLWTLFWLAALGHALLVRRKELPQDVVLSVVSVALAPGAACLALCLLWHYFVALPRHRRALRERDVW